MVAVRARTHVYGGRALRYLSVVVCRCCASCGMCYAVLCAVVQMHGNHSCAQVLC